jgi:ketosteroid isomerase-like protein
MKIVCIALFAGLCGVRPCASQQGPDQYQIRSLRAQSNQAIARQDVPGIVSFLDNEFQITTGNGRLLSGRAGMERAFVEQFAQFEDAAYVRTPESVEVASSAPFASEAGTWVGSWTAPDGVVRTGGSYAAYWRKVGGTWRIRSELFVTLFCEGAGCS